MIQIAQTMRLALTDTVRTPVSIPEIPVALMPNAKPFCTDLFVSVGLAGLVIHTGSVISVR